APLSSTSSRRRGKTGRLSNASHRVHLPGHNAQRSRPSSLTATLGVTEPIPARVGQCSGMFPEASGSYFASMTVVDRDLKEVGLRTFEIDRDGRPSLTEIQHRPIEPIDKAPRGFEVLSEKDATTFACVSRGSLE